MAAIGSWGLVRTVNGVIVPAVGRWEFDHGHTEVGFEGRHLATPVRGRFTRFNGRLLVAEIPEQSSAEIEIDAASLLSDFRDRDEHLRSAEWFDVEKYPVIRFRSHGLRHVIGSRWRAVGNLEVHGVRRDTELEVEFGGAEADPWGNNKLGFVAVTTIDRGEFGLNWNAPLGSGGFLVGREVTLRVSVEAKLAS